MNKISTPLKDVFSGILRKIIATAMIFLLAMTMQIVSPRQAYAAGNGLTIRIGDVDGFGYGDGAGYTAAYGKSVNLDGQGTLTLRDFLPDLNLDGQVAINSGDDFNNRSTEEAAGSLTTTTGTWFIDTGSTGSDYTDDSLVREEADDPAVNPPSFKFNFKVAKDKLPDGTTTELYLNVMVGDYDTEFNNNEFRIPVTLKTANGLTLDGKMVTSAKGSKDGRIRSASMPLTFYQVFVDGDSNGEAGYWLGSLEADFPIPEDPYTAFDFAEISTEDIAIDLTENNANIYGMKWEDINENGIADTFIIGDPPDVVFVIDTSGSTGNAFVGSTIGDVNGDGKADTILDAEIAGFIALNQQLTEQGFGDTAQVTIISFSTSPTQVDMDPVASGVQIDTFPEADKDYNGILDVDQALKALRDGGSTYYEPALQLAQSNFQSLNTADGDGNLIFLSDGVPSDPGTYGDEAQSLRDDGINVSAFGAGTGAQLAPLQVIDPGATIFTSTDELLNVFSGLETPCNGTEPGYPGVTIYLDSNNNGSLDAGEPSTVTDAKGFYQFEDLAAGTYVVREVVDPSFTQTAPASGFFTVTLAQDQTVADKDFGNALVGGSSCD
ncbi:MAG: VWA domain-containing protein [Symploca sp. SIO2E9]|nr:VWA domain-containing protein [Symploca sp. SIO2E9]